ncbi:hypothetical protein B9Z55_028794 [Caenorhabditis nigoni]|uniref:Uncharacterized protein n=1 Tax=Caenorhabditis nigoni TaxID=1611254 RepID=A0A2G5SA24_9PELO|nr:hypothetical protein B9Z55_028794 [Caenorhabditis nigoni]
MHHGALRLAVDCLNDRMLLSKAVLDANKTFSTEEANVDAPKSDNPSAVLRGNPDFISDGPVADEAPDDLRQQAVLHDHPAPPHSHRVRSCPRTVPCVPHATTPQTKENFKKYTVTRRAFWKTMTNAAPLDTTI